uniref:Uncharacterized protein n=1 Tax=Hyaloperonospora arabidopsidis (strain Emoy2) TaxID=559515 RepID=M4BXA2_HYAAE
MSKFGAVKSCEGSIWTCASTTKVIVHVFVNCGPLPTLHTLLKLCLQTLQERFAILRFV